MYVPGCPPRPDAFMEGLTLLATSVGKEKRPLSWAIGEQGVIRPEKISLRDSKREERMKMTSCKSPDEI
ncbi:NADH-quinone oxidoreductase subunit B [compost metagenome]